MGFIMLFYVIFGTNLLTEGPLQIAVFCLFQCFAEKEYQTERNLREDLFWNKCNLGDLEWKSRNRRGSQEVGGAPTPLGASSTLVGPSWLHRPTSSSDIYLHTLKTSEDTTKT